MKEKKERRGRDETRNKCPVSAAIEPGRRSNTAGYTLYFHMRALGFSLCRGACLNGARTGAPRSLGHGRPPLALWGTGGRPSRSLGHGRPPLALYGTDGLFGARTVAPHALWGHGRAPLTLSRARTAAPHALWGHGRAPLTLSGARTAAPTPSISSVGLGGGRDGGRSSSFAGVGRVGVGETEETK